MEARRCEVVSKHDIHFGQRHGLAEPLQSFGSRSYVQEPFRPAADADDIRFQGKRAQDVPSLGRGNRTNRQSNESHDHGYSDAAADLERRPVSKHTQYWRRSDGYR